MFVLVLCVLLACNRNRYEVVERTEKEVPNFQTAGTHTEVHYVLMHDNHKIYATCDTIGLDDPTVRCSFRPLRTYQCELGNISMEKASKVPLSDLKCNDGEGHNVYLYVDKKE